MAEEYVVDMAGSVLLERTVRKALHRCGAVESREEPDRYGLDGSPPDANYKVLLLDAQGERVGKIMNYVLPFELGPPQVEAIDEIMSMDMDLSAMRQRFADLGDSSPSDVLKADLLKTIKRARDMVSHEPTRLVMVLALKRMLKLIQPREDVRAAAKEMMLKLLKEDDVFNCTAKKAVERVNKEWGRAVSEEWTKQVDIATGVSGSGNVKADQESHHQKPMQLSDKPRTGLEDKWSHEVARHLDRASRKAVASTHLGSSSDDCLLMLYRHPATSPDLQAEVIMELRRRGIAPWLLKEKVQMVDVEDSPLVAAAGSTQAHTWMDDPLSKENAEHEGKAEVEKSKKILEEVRLRPQSVQEESKKIMDEFPNRPADIDPRVFEDDEFREEMVRQEESKDAGSGAP